MVLEKMLLRILTFLAININALGKHLVANQPDEIANTQTIQRAPGFPVKARQPMILQWGSSKIKRAACQTMEYPKKAPLEIFPLDSHYPKAAS